MKKIFYLTVWALCVWMTAPVSAQEQKPYFAEPGTLLTYESINEKGKVSKVRSYSEIVSSYEENGALWVDMVEYDDEDTKRLPSKAFYKNSVTYHQIDFSPMLEDMKADDPGMAMMSFTGPAEFDIPHGMEPGAEMGDVLLPVKADISEEMMKEQREKMNVDVDEEAMAELEREMGFDISPKLGNDAPAQAFSMGWKLSNRKFHGYETVETPAGRFENCAKISYEFHMMVPEMNASVPIFKAVEWYAPGVGEVKCEEYMMGATKPISTDVLISVAKAGK